VNKRREWLDVLRKAEYPLISSYCWLQIGGLLELWAYLTDHLVPTKYWIVRKDEKDPSKVKLDLSIDEFRDIKEDLLRFVEDLIPISGKITFYRLNGWPKVPTAKFLKVVETYLNKDEQQYASKFVYFYRPDLKPVSFKGVGGVVVPEPDPEMFIKTVYRLIPSPKAKALYRDLKFMEPWFLGQSVQFDPFKELKKRIGAQWRKFVLVVLTYLESNGTIWPDVDAKEGPDEFVASYFAKTKLYRYPDLLSFIQ